MECTFSKLKSGDWGVRIVGHAQANSVVDVTTKAGKIKQVTLKHLIWGDGTVELWEVNQFAGADRTSITVRNLPTGAEDITI